MQKTNSAPEALAELDKQEALKKRAAKQAAKRELAPTVHPQVTCTVLPMGDGKISMGEHISGLGEAHFEEGETFPVALPIALALYVKGYVNFDGAKEAMADFRKSQASQEAADRREKEEFDRVVGGAGG